MNLIIFLICFCASVIGAICGIGGGVIIKPVLDALGVAEVATISFLSGCTVLAMTTYSVTKSKLSGDSRVSFRIGFPLALGAAVGGILGKWGFSVIRSMSAEPERVGAIQALCLLVVTLGTLLYTVFKKKIHTLQIDNSFVSVIIGMFLGVLSSFLGIGGGPINLVVFYFFFSMSTKTAAENSLYVIFFSQIASLIQSLVTGNVPDFEPGMLILMIVGGISGGILGRYINKKIQDKHVERLFQLLMIVMILINIYNIYRYW